jgi:hypothetical protein
VSHLRYWRISANNCKDGIVKSGIEIVLMLQIDAPATLNFERAARAFVVNYKIRSCPSDCFSDFAAISARILAKVNWFFGVSSG